MRKGLCLGLSVLLLSPVPVLAEGVSPPASAPVSASPPATGAPITTVLSAGPGTMMPGEMSSDGSFGNVDGGTSQPRVWANAEFLLWWTKGVPVNTPLLTAATNPNDPTSGSLASTNTAVLLGGQTYGLGTRYGGRFTLGATLDPDGMMGVEGSYLFIAPRSTTTMFGSKGGPNDPTLGTPFFDTSIGQENFVGVAGPGFAGGGFLTLSNQLQSGELNLLTRLSCGDNFSLSGLVGFRYLYFQEKLVNGSGNQGLAGSGNDGDYFSEVDRFQASNNFYGANFGLRGEYRLGGLFVNATGKCAVGAVNQIVNVSGAAVDVTPGGGPAANFALPAGVFALPTNSGQHTQTGFAVVPELNGNDGYDLTRNIRAYVGYTFLYIDNVARPGTQIDHAINPTQSFSVNATGNQLVGAPVPAFSFTRTDFWAQGINFGLALRW